MASSGNFGVWNPLNVGSGGSTSLTVGNTNAVMTGADPRTTGTVGGVISDTDGYYFETVATSTGSGALTLGIVNEDRHNQCMAGQIHSRSGSYMWRSYDSGAFFVETSSNTSYGTFADGDVIGWFVKNSKLYVKKNNSDVVGDVVNTSAGIDISGGFFFPAVSRTVGGGAQTSSILRTDSDDWSYSPPTGFKSLTSKDMLVDSNIDPAQTDDDYPAKNFNVVPYTGNQTDGRAVTGVGFAPDLVWIKQRASFSNPNILTDTVRGATKRIESNVDIAEATDSDGLQSFTSDGFTLGTNDKYNWTSSHTYVAWCWKGGGAPTATNSAGAGATPTSGSVKIDGSNLGSALAGSIPATKLSANTKGGFSIIAYTGTGSNATIAHGLSAKPDFILTKRTSSQQTWGVYHTSLGATKYLALNTNADAGTDSTFWNNTEPTTSVISLGTEGRVNGNSQNYVAYAWHNVEGMQRFGTYIGNGNADGQFIYMGFRPRLFVTKKLGTDNWIVIDSARETFNAMGEKVLLWDTNDLEFDPSAVNLDFVSNGVKMRNTDGKINASGTEYVYMAWGDVPFKYNNTF